MVDILYQKPDMLPLNLKQALKLDKNWKAWSPICNSTTIPAMWIKEEVCYITSSINISK